MNRKSFLKTSFNISKAIVLSPIISSLKKPLSVFADKSFSLETMVGQILMIGIKDDWSYKNPGVLKWISPGAIILYQRNISSKKQLKVLTKDLKIFVKDKCGITPFISIDHEGGRVNRLPKNEFTAFPSNSYYGKNFDVEGIRKEAKIMAQQLLEVGININLAPVVDVISNSKNSDIAGRSYSSDPKIVTELAKTFIEESIKNQMLVTAKHFPGYGAISENPHNYLPTVNISYEQWSKIHLLPYLTAIKSNVPAIMTGHVIYTNLENKKIPTSLSFEIITKILKEKLNYNGLIMTDDLEMGAITKLYSPEQSAINAVMAGNDMLLFCHSETAQRKAFRGLVNYAKQSTELQNRIYNSFMKIRNLKINTFANFK